MALPPIGVPRKETTFAIFEDKIRDAQRDKFSVKDQLDTVDWWIARLGDLRDKIQRGKPI